MGRVRRYTKIKAIDPFSKAVKPEINTSYDEPPDNFYQRKAKREKKIHDSFEDQDILVRKQAFQMLRIENEKTLSKAKKVEGKREDESLKKFKNRIRQETRVTLRDELQKLTKTSQKRKQRLKERKNKKRGGNTDNTYDEDVIHFQGEVEGEDDVRADSNRSTHNGGDNDALVVPARLRASDIGGPSSFAGPERIGFGEVACRPPDIKQFNLKKRKLDSDNNNSVKKHPSSILQYPGSDLKPCIIHHGSGTTATEQEMELLRERVQEAYRQVRDKRRTEGHRKM